MTLPAFNPRILNNEDFPPAEGCWFWAHSLTPQIQGDRDETAWFTFNSDYVNTLVVSQTKHAMPAAPSKDGLHCYSNYKSFFHLSFMVWTFIQLMMIYNMFYQQILITAHYFHLATSTYWVCLLVRLIGGRLCVASGLATRDVHLLNSIIGVYHLSYHQLPGWKQIPSGHVHVHRVRMMVPILPLGSSSPLSIWSLQHVSSANISMHEGLLWWQVCHCMSGSYSITQIYCSCEFAYFPINI